MLTTGCYDGVVSRAIFAANSREYHIRKVWSACRIQIWHSFSKFQHYRCRYLYVQTRLTLQFCPTSHAGEWTTNPFALCIRMKSYEETRLFSIIRTVWETLGSCHIFCTGSTAHVRPWPSSRSISRRLYHNYCSPASNAHFLQIIFNIFQPSPSWL